MLKRLNNILNAVQNAINEFSITYYKKNDLQTILKDDNITFQSQYVYLLAHSKNVREHLMMIAGHYCIFSLLNWLKNQQKTKNRYPSLSLFF